MKLNLKNEEDGPALLVLRFNQYNQFCLESRDAMSTNSYNCKDRLSSILFSVFPYELCFIPSCPFMLCKRFGIFYKVSLWNVLVIDSIIRLTLYKVLILRAIVRLIYYDLLFCLVLCCIFSPFPNVKYCFSNAFYCVTSFWLLCVCVWLNDWTTL